MNPLSYKLRILSLGAGVQSSTLYLMAEKGEIPPFHCAIFADTGWESAGTYAHLEWLQSIGKCPIIVVRRDMTILEHSMGADTRRKNANMCGLQMPVYIILENGKHAIGRRECTYDFKIDPIRKETRRLLGIKPRQRAPQGAVEQCIGISLDEARRMKISRDRMTTLSYPLVDMRMTRLDCEKWLARNYGGLVVPKSSCIGCPFHSNNEWRQVKSDPMAWAQAVLLDNRIRSVSGFRGELYLHRSCKPLEEVDLRTAEDKGQMSLFTWQKDEKLNLFVNKLSIYE